MHINSKSVIFSIMLGVILLVISGCGQNIKAQNTSKTAKITDLTVNYKDNPMNIDIINSTPVFSWRMEDDTPGQKQTAYRIVVSDSEKNLEKNKYVWDSGRVESDSSVAALYGGGQLNTATKYYWKVYVWDKDDNIAEAMDVSSFETGITDDEWDGAKWIGLGSDSYDKAGEMITYPESYTIEYDFKFNKKDSDSSFIWGAENGRYGSYYQCEVNTCGDEIKLIVGEAYNGEYVNKTEETLTGNYAGVFDDKQAFNDNIHSIKITVCGKSVLVFLDDIEVLESESDGMPDSGSVGLWTTRGAFYAYYDNIKITANDGKIICGEDFENPDNNIFTPYYIKTDDGWCEASSGFIMMSGWETPAPMLRREFETDATKSIESARLYVSALGIYDIYINGNDVCSEYMAPGQSIYSESVYYRTYDITNSLNNGSNAIGVVIGHGRYNRGNENWGERLALIGKLVINYSDKTSDVFVTDDSWTTYDNGPVRADDMYDGEYYDSNFEINGWSEPSFDGTGWKGAVVFDEYDGLCKEPAVSNPVTVIDEISPVSVLEPEAGVYVYDFGQNFNGNIVINFKDININQGDVVTVRYSEWLNDDNLACKDDEAGTIYTENLYTAKNTDYYVASGKDDAKYTPAFVYRGFRYVQITGLSSMPPTDAVKAYVISSDNERTGSFTCSDENINSLYNAVYWSQLSNYCDLPTDCPQRDERFGWAGDAQVFAKTAAYNSNIYSFMNNYINILRNGQGKNGAYPEIALEVNDEDAVNGWSDAGVILAWELYVQYGNLGIINENLEAMCRYVDNLVATSDNYIRSKSDYSDHNALSLIGDDMADTAQCAYVALLVSKMGKAVGADDTADKYSQIYERFKSAWQEAYINEDGSIGEWLQSEYVLGLEFGLYPDGLSKNGAQFLDISLAANDYHINTGYIATQFLLPILCDYGYNETAYKILMQDTYPSWNYMISSGNTTITEGWNTMYDLGDGTYTINGSLNHMALGSVGQWIYEYMLGIKSDENAPAFKHFYLEPVVSTELEYAGGSYKSMYGEIKSSWKIEENEIIYNFTIPANTTATVSLGADGYNNMELEAGTYEYKIPRKYKEE